MGHYLLFTGFLLGMLIGVLIMNRIYDKHSKEMQEIEVDFEDWKVQRHKQFIAELDEIDRKQRNYVIYPPSREEFKSKEYVKNPNTIDPTKVINEIKKERVFNSVETNESPEQEHIPYKSHYGVDYSKHDYPE